MQIKITEIHPKDAFYEEQHLVIGQIGTLERLDVSEEYGYFAGDVLIPEYDDLPIYFYAFKYEVSTQSPENV